MEVICLEEEAFFTLIEKVVERMHDKNPEIRKKWIPDEEAMNLLNITSKTSLQKLRDEGDIRFSQPFKKVILYDRDSIEVFLERKANKHK